MTGTSFQIGFARMRGKELESIRVGQHDVEQDQVGGGARVDAFDRLAPVGNGLDRESFPLGQVAQQVSHMHIVLDDQEALRCVRLTIHTGPPGVKNTR